MAGILNSKNRILDTIIKREGRRQIASGDIRIRFASFSDRSTFYQGDILSGTADASERLFFEAASVPQDRITFEADDSGKLMPLESEGGLNVFGGKIISGSQSAGTRKFVTSSNVFSSLSNDLLSGSLNNFDKLRIIGSNDFFSDETNFRISETQSVFTMTDDLPISESEIQAISVDKVDSLFQDKRLSHIDNFKFLPPRNSPSLDNPKGSQMGEYRPLNQLGIFTFEDLMGDLEGLESQTVEFTETSRTNNIFAQLFEVSPNNMSKLDVIDFGSFPFESGDAHVFFAGKVYLDSMGRHTFVNLFTMVFE